MKLNWNLELTESVLLVTPIDNVIEDDGGHLYVTLNWTRHQLDQQSSGGGWISSLNWLTWAVQTFSNGTSWTAPIFNSATSIHTLNIPMASTISVTAWLISKTEYDSFSFKQSALNGTGFVKASGTSITYDNSTYLTSLSWAVLTDQTSGQTIGATGTRLTKLRATDITVTNAISGAVTWNAWTVTNWVYTWDAGTVFLAPNGSAASLTSFPTLNQDTTGTASKTNALNSATTVVNVSSATAPSTWQFLVATDSTHATWQTIEPAPTPFIRYLAY